MKNIFLIFFLGFSLPVFAKIDESGPGNGTDYVKVLFAEAHLQLLSSVATVNVEDIQNLGLEAITKKWLLESAQGATRWEGIKHYLRVMDLRFQQAPCTDASQKPASICFFNSEQGPYVLISLLENKMTTSDQAMAMLIHEAGHFLGERDHLFLDKVGVELVAALQRPALFIADAESTDTVASPLAEKDQCEAGTSAQATKIKKKLLVDLTLQCGQRKVQCDFEKTQFVFAGTANFQPGVGYDMTVTCRGRGVLSLR